jgi:predicted metal-dependent hydrolase
LVVLPVALLLSSCAVTVLQILEPVAAPQYKHWHHTPLLTWCFDSLSIALPAGEAFVGRVAQQAVESGLPPPVTSAVSGLVADEHAHARAHRLYNQRLDAMGYRASERAALIDDALQSLGRRLSPAAGLALAAGFEALAVGLSRLCLAGSRWLPQGGSQAAALWRWHAREEVAHGDSMRQLLAHRHVPWPLRAAMSLLAAALLLLDVSLGVTRMAAVDLRLKRTAWSSLPLGVVDLTWRLFQQMLHRGGRKPRGSPQRLQVRLLQLSDVSALTELETLKWCREQAATAPTLRARIVAYPALSLGVFCEKSGKALASLFLKPMSRERLVGASSWAESAMVDDAPGALRDCTTLFGISLSSTDPRAVLALLHHFWPQALHMGCKRILLGSPMPGLRAHLHAHPKTDALAYATAKRAGAPLDPQLRYYHRHGFLRLVAVKPNYFPDSKSLDHAALLEANVPLSCLTPLWRKLPLPAVCAACSSLLWLGVGPR